MGKRNDDLWAEAKRRCRLNAETIRMAKELQLNPRSLIKNIPNPRDPWKAPVHVWIRDLYEARRERASRKKVAPKTSDLAADEVDCSSLVSDESAPIEDRIPHENALMRQRQSQFRQAASRVARAFGSIPGIARVALFGSVAAPLQEELPRFREFRARGFGCFTSVTTWTSRSGWTISVICRDCGGHAAGR